MLRSNTASVDKSLDACEAKCLVTHRAHVCPLNILLVYPIEIELYL